MLLSEPPATQYDLRFSIFGIPVRVHPMFWVIAIVLGFCRSQMIQLVMWVIAMFIGILVHELGHALVMRHYGLKPWITLYGMGGMASLDPAQMVYSRADNWIRQIIISLAGAGVGFLLALAIVGVLVASGQNIQTEFGFPFGFFVQTGDLGSLPLNEFINSLLFVCIVWGLLNLLPIYPLDGGQVSREICLRFSARQGIRVSLTVSLIVASMMALWAGVNLLQEAQLLAKLGLSPFKALRGASFFVAMLFGYFAYANYITLRAYLGSRQRW